MLTVSSNLFEKVAPYQYYAPVQNLLNRFNIKNARKPSWQSDLYTRHIGSVAEMFLEDDLDFKTEISIQKYEAVLQYLGKGSSDLPMLNEAVTEAMLERAWFSVNRYIYFGERERELHCALFKISVAYVAYETLESEECPFTAEQKEEFKSKLCAKIRVHYNRVYRRYFLQAEQNNHPLAWVRSQFDKAGVIFTIDNLKLLYHSDLDLKSFFKNLIWMSVRSIWLFPLTFLALLYVKPFKKAWKFIIAFVAENHGQDRMLREMLAGLAILFLCLAGYVYFMFHLVAALSLLNALGGITLMTASQPLIVSAMFLAAPYFSQLVVYGLLGSIVLAVLPVAATGIARLGKSLFSFFSEVNWQPNLVEKQRISDRNARFFDEENDEELSLEEVGELLTVPVAIPLNEQVVLTSEDIIQLRRQVIAQRLSNPALEEAILHAYQNSWNETPLVGARGFLSSFRLSGMGNDCSFERFKDAVATALEAEVKIDDRSFPRMD